MTGIIAQVKKLLGQAAGDESETPKKPETSDAVKRDTARRIREAQEKSKSHRKKRDPYRYIKPKHI